MEGVQIRLVHRRIAVVEEVEETGLARAFLAARQALGGPAVEPVARRRQQALFQVRRRIELQEGLGQRAVAGADGRLIGLGVRRRRRRQQEPQRADLALVEARHQRHGRLFAPVEDLDQLFRQDLAVDRAPRGITLGQRRRRQFLSVHAAKIRQVLTSQLGLQPDAHRLCGRVAVAGGAQFRRRDHIGALGDRLVEQAARLGRGHQIHDAERPGGLSGDGDIARIAPEGGDVALDPFQGRDLVEQPVVTRDFLSRFSAQLGVRQIAQHPQPIVDRHHHHALGGGHAGAVVHGLVRGAGGQGSAVNPDEDRCSLGALRRPDVEEQAVLAHRRLFAGIDALAARHRLMTGGAEPGRIARPGPGRHLGGRTPAAPARGRQGVRHAPENVDPVDGLAPQRSGRSLDHRPRFRPRRRLNSDASEGGQARQNMDSSFHYDTTSFCDWSRIFRARPRNITIANP